jgi:U3 small nucleolar RNA-associated protein 12
MEVWSFDMDKEQRLLFTGSGEGELKAWNVDQQGLQSGVRADEAGEVMLHVLS